MNQEATFSFDHADGETRTSHRVRVVAREFSFLPMRGGLVLGRRAAVGCHAVRKVLHLLMAAPFAHIELDDEVISDIIVRESVLRRFPREHLIAFVLAQIKPLMGAEEILHLEIETEVLLESRPIRRPPREESGGCP